MGGWIYSVCSQNWAEKHCLVSTEHSDTVEAKSAEQPSAEQVEVQSNFATGDEETATNQDPPDQQQGSSKEDTVTSKPPSQESQQENQHQHDHSNSPELDNIQQQMETVESSQPCSEHEKHDQSEQHSIESSSEAKHNEQLSESEKQQSEECMDDNVPTSSTEQQHQKEQEETQHQKEQEEMQHQKEQEETASQPTAVESENLQPSTEQDTAVAAGEIMEVTNDGNKEDEVAMETSVDPPQLTSTANQPSVEDEQQPELMPTVNEVEQRAKESDPVRAEEETEAHNDKTNTEEKDRNIEMKATEEIIDREVPNTNVTSTEDSSVESRVMEQNPSGEDQPPVKDRVAAESFTLELDEDSLGNSSIFIEDEPSNEVLVDPDTSPPGSKKRKGKPRKLGTRTAKSKVCT